MKIQKAVWMETRKIAIGVLILSVLMVFAFIGLGDFDYTVLLGALMGVAGAIGNFFFMALTVQQITQQIHGVKRKKEVTAEKQENETDAVADPFEEAEEEPLTAEEEADLREQTVWAKKKMQRSHALRMLVVVIIGVIGLKVSCFHPVSVMVPFLFPRIVIMINSFIEKKKGV